MEGRQRPLAQAEKADTRRGPGGVPEGPRPGSPPTGVGKGTALRTGRKGAPRTALSELGWGLRASIQLETWKEGIGETTAPSHPLQAPGPPSSHLGQALGTMSPPSRKLLRSQELLMARLGSSPFSGYLCQRAPSWGARLCTDFRYVFPFSSPWPCELGLPQLGPSYRVNRAEWSSPVLAQGQKCRGHDLD